MRSIKDDLSRRRIDAMRTRPLRCQKGARCGDRCIPRNQECHKGLGSRPLKKIEENWKKLSPLEKTAIVGTTGAILVGGGALSTIAKPIASQVVQGLSKAVKEESESIFSGIGKASSTATTAAAQAAAEQFSKNESVIKDRLQDLAGGAATAGVASAAKAVQQAWDTGGSEAASQRLQSLLQDQNPVIRQYGRELTQGLVEGLGAGVANTARAAAQGVGTAAQQVGRTVKNASQEAAASGWERDRKARRRLYKWWRKRQKRSNIETKGDSMQQELQCPKNYKVCGRRCVPMSTNCRAANFRRAAGRIALGAGLAAGAAYSYSKSPMGREFARKWQEGADDRFFSRELGINRNSKPSEVKQAYYKYARKNHPDQGGNEENMKRINQIWNNKWRGRRDSRASIWAEGF